MKILTKIASFFLLFVLICCDDFQNTNRYFSTDKKIYTPGDSIFLTVNIVPKSGSKEIRLYKNLRNLNIWLMFSVPYKSQTNEITSVASEEGIKTIPKPLTEKKTVEKIIISKNFPYQKTLLGKITEDKETYIINFKNYGLIFKISKKAYKDVLSLNFHGHLMPINPVFGDSFEDYFDVHSIKIR